MITLNNNSIKILINVRDKENNLGLCKGRGITKDILKEKSGLSESTINRAIKLLKDEGYIDDAIKNINKKAYYISKKGIEMLKILNEKSI